MANDFVQRRDPQTHDYVEARRRMKHVYVVYRVDLDRLGSPDAPQLAIKIKSVHSTEREADAEVARLNSNADRASTSIYCWQSAHSHLEP